MSRRLMHKMSGWCTPLKDQSVLRFYQVLMFLSLSVIFFAFIFFEQTFQNHFASTPFIFYVYANRFKPEGMR